MFENTIGININSLGAQNANFQFAKMNSNLIELAINLKFAISANDSIREVAEIFLKKVETSDNFTTSLLKIAKSNDFDGVTRQCAAVTFKNVIKFNWVNVSVNVDFSYLVCKNYYL